MDCPTCRELLPEYRDGALIEALSLAVRTHLDRCADCRAELAAEQVLDALLTAAPLRQPPAGFTATVLSRVAAIRGESALVPWFVTLASVLSAAALLAGLRRVADAVPWVPQPGAAWSAVARILGVGQGGGPTWWRWPLDLTADLPLHPPLPGLEVLQMGTLATAAVTGLALVTLRIAARALVRT